MKIKLLGRTLLQNGKRFCFVSPHFIKASALLAGVNGVFNAVCVRASEVGEVLFAGPGAGRYPTASAVVGDIIDIVKNPGRVQPAGWDACNEAPASFSQFHARFYVRIPEADRAALETYKNDPRHKAVSALCKSIRTDRAAVDCLLPDPED